MSEFKAKEVSVDLDAVSGETVIQEIEPIQDDSQEGADEQEEQNDDSSEEGQEDSGSDEGADNDSDDNDSNESEDSEDDSQEEEDVDEEDYQDEDLDEYEDDTQEDNNDDVVDYEELPEAVQEYLTFFEETGGSISDFMNVNRDFDKMGEDQVIREYYKKMNPYLDDADIDYELKNKFSFDPDTDSEDDVRKLKIAKKKLYGEAIKSLKADSEKYRTELVSSSRSVPQDAQEAIEFKRSYEQQTAQQQQAIEQKRNSFVAETNKVLGKDFKGFEIDLGEGNIELFKPEDVKKTKESNMDVNNLLNRFTDKEGNVTDVQGYHKALTIASNPEAFAKYFYDKGKADMAEDDVKTSKNIRMAPRQVQTGKSNSKMSVKSVKVNSSGQPQVGKPLIKLKNY